MIHNDPEVILPETFDLLVRLQRDFVFDAFFLVDGTGLALHIGHRLSIDLDLFSTEDFDTEQLESHLSRKFDFQTDFVAQNTLKGYINGIKVDFITHAYVLVEPLILEDNVRLASMVDIGAMKLNAIAHSGNRQKDFYDMYFLLKHYPLQKYLNAYHKKYPNSNPIIPLKAVSWFDDIDFELEKPMLKRNVTFEAVKKRLLEATVDPGKVF